MMKPLKSYIHTPPIFSSHVLDCIESSRPPHYRQIAYLDVLSGPKLTPIASTMVSSTRLSATTNHLRAQPIASVQITHQCFFHAAIARWATRR